MLVFHDYLSVALLNHKLLEITGQILLIFAYLVPSLKWPLPLLPMLGKSVEISLPSSGKQINIRYFRDTLKVFLLFRVKIPSVPPSTWEGNLCGPTMIFWKNCEKGFEDVDNCSFCLEFAYSFKCLQNVLTLPSHWPSLINCPLLCASKKLCSCLYFSLYHIAL